MSVRATEDFQGVEAELTHKIINIYYTVYNELGYGFLEAIYSRAMAIGLAQQGLKVMSEKPLPVAFRGEIIGTYKADLVVEGKVILELKTANDISRAHEAQLTHYLRATNVEVGLVLSFGVTARFRRVEFRNERKRLFQGSSSVLPLSALS